MFSQQSSHLQTNFAQAIRLEAVSSRTRGTTEVVTVSLQALSVTLALIALLILAVVDADGVFSTPLALWSSLQAASLIVGAVWIRRFSASCSTTPTVIPSLVMLAISSFLWEPIGRGLLAVGRPLEILVMHALGAVVWGLALVSLWPKYQGIAVLMSLFLAAFSLSTAHRPAMQGLAAAFALVAISWLTVRYWDHLSGRLRGHSRKLRRELLVPGLALLFVLLAFTAGNHGELMATLNGFLPSSGGTGDSNAHARQGIGNGEMLVAGCENIQSFGPIDEAPFMTDDKPSLYDVFDDTYDEPIMPLNTDRAVALMPDKTTMKKEHLHTQTQKANREFSTARKPSGKRRNDVKNVDSDALFYVSGRTPLHLRLELYDTFDGVNWYAEADPSLSETPTMTMVKDSGRDWLRLPDRSKAWKFLGPAEAHAVKIVQLETNIIPAPLHLHGVHIADVNRIDIYKPGPQGLVRMDREKLPELVPIHLVSRTVNNSQLIQKASGFGDKRYRDVPESLRSELTRLAQEWGIDSPRGSTQIETVVRHLRQRYQHDHDFREPADVPSPVLSFLIESRRGPDYQFATAAALLLRTWNYPTRVVSGFYVSPDDYDVTSRHTPVNRDDVHFWAEVCLENGAWITVEPTPGYEVLLPPLDWWETFRQYAGSICTNLWQYRLSWGVGILLLWGMIWFRHIIADMWSMVNWRLRPGKRNAVQAWKILARRLRKSGWKMSHGITPRQSLQQIASVRPEFSFALQDFSSLLEREVFGDPASSDISKSCICSDQVLELLSRSTCRNLARQRRGISSPWSLVQSHCVALNTAHHQSISA